MRIPTPTAPATEQSLYGHFKRSEFLCKCGRAKCSAQSLIISHELIAWLNDIRQYTGTPLIINSGYRCPAHNLEVGGLPTSSHLTGNAVDISCTTSRYRDKLLGAIYCTRFGTSRIGIARTFIHLDNDRTKHNGLLWLYNT